MRTVDNQVLTALHQIRDAIKNKECCNGEGNSDSSSKEITIDDVVKFIHDNTTQNQFYNFPYTKYSDIKHISDSLEYGETIVKGTEQEITDFFNLHTDGFSVTNMIFMSTNYNILIINKYNPT